MSKQFYQAICFFALSILLLGCTKDKLNEQYTFYRPVYQTKAEVRLGIKAVAHQPVEQAGKIVLKDNYLYLNEPDKGVHIIDISNPSAPVSKYFIAIPGAMDIAVNGNYLYADCYTDLVTIDISDPAQAKLKNTLEGVFPHRYYSGFSADTSKVILNWQRVDTTVSTRFTGSLNDRNPFGNVLILAQSSFAGAAPSSPYGIAGSMARFALSNSYMYTVSYSDIKTFNIANAANPIYRNQQSIGTGDIETIFPFKQYLFIGSRSGMYIYDASIPDQVKKLSQFTHARSCDPVIADDTHAYVTLWGGSACGGFTNQLDVIDIKNISSPQLVKTYSLTAPKGLSKDGNLLFICDGGEGLKIFSTTNPSMVIQVGSIGGFNGTDVIAVNGLAIVTAKEGLYLIDYTNPAQPKLKSVINLKQ